MPPPLGAHVSIAGGVSRAIDRGLELDCTALQVFVKNASQWRGKPLDEDEIGRFRSAHSESSIGPIVAHATYLINLSATNPDNLARSRTTLRDELDRCDQLGIAGLVVHPGAHLGAGVDAALELIAESLRVVLDQRPRGSCRVLLENTAGQGTVVGYELDQLAKIRELTDRADRVGLCIDTCHAFAAGYPIHEVSAFDGFFAEIAELFGDDSPDCIHLNDSRFEIGSRRDRHANLGAGHIGRGLFERLVNAPALLQVPMILETPLGDDEAGHRRDLELLRSL